MKENELAEEKATADITSEENFLSILLTVAIPLVITLTAFGAIALAFYQWKIY